MDANLKLEAALAVALKTAETQRATVPALPEGWIQASCQAFVADDSQAEAAALTIIDAHSGYATSWDKRPWLAGLLTCAPRRQSHSRGGWRNAWLPRKAMSARCMPTCAAQVLMSLELAAYWRASDPPTWWHSLAGSTNSRTLPRHSYLPEQRSNDDQRNHLGGVQTSECAPRPRALTKGSAA